MQAGRLNELVDIMRPTQTVNDYGEREDTLSCIYSTRAKVTNTSGNRTTENSEIVYTYAYEFNVRSYVPVAQTDIIRWQDNNYRILTMQKRREYNDILIQAELIND